MWRTDVQVVALRRRAESLHSKLQKRVASSDATNSAVAADGTGGAREKKADAALEIS